jgi:hypothetical protein
MALNISGAYKWLKRALIIGSVLLLAGLVLVWYVFTEKFTDTHERNAEFTVNAVDFIHEFERNDSLANAKYAEKIIIVNGIISDIEAADTTMNLKITESSTGSYIIFSFQQQNLVDVKKIKKGDNVSIKGSCSGGIHSEILEIESITFKRCVLNNNK